MNLIEKMFKGLFKKFNFTASATLLDGKELRIVGGNLVEGAQVFIETKEGELALPDGTFELQEGYTIVTNGGMIVSAMETVEETNVPEPLKEEAVEMSVVEVSPQVVEVTEPEAVIAMEEVQPVTVETPVVDFESKLDTLLLKIDGISSSYAELLDKFNKFESETEMKFEKVSTIPSLKKMDKDVPANRPAGSMLGSYEELMAKTK